jgi:hypothetical protein
MFAITHSLVWLFVTDLFHQFLFYFGGVVAVVILIWEKRSAKPAPWRLIFSLLLACVFLSSFQAWIDEHRNAETLINEKAKLSSANSALQQKLDAKQIEVDWLRDHQQVHVESGNALDPRVASILDRLNRENQTLRNTPGNNLKKNLVNLAKEMADFFQKVRIPYEQASSEMSQPQLGSDAVSPQQRWAQHTNNLARASIQMDATIQDAMLSSFSPRALIVLEELRTQGEKLTGLKDADINEASHRCSVPSGGSYWGIQFCIERLSGLVQQMH